MSDQNLPASNGPQILLNKGMDVMKDPNASKAAKVGAVGLVAVAAIAVVAMKTIDAMGK